MIYTLPAFVAGYWPYLLGIAVFLAVLSYYSKRFYSVLKKVILIFVALFAVAAGYELLTGSSIISLPGKVERELNKTPTDHETGHRYYKSYEERYGEKTPE